MVHSVNGCTRGVQVKLWDPLRTCAIPERLSRCVHDKALYKSTFTFTLPYVYGPVLKQRTTGGTKGLKWQCSISCHLVFVLV